MPIILQKLYTLINTTLNPSSTFMESVSDATIEALIKQSEFEKGEIKTLLIEGIIERQKIMDKQQYVQVNQALLIRLLDKLYLYRKNKGLDNKILSLYNNISQHLEDVLNFIEDFFSNYFDRNEKVPAPYLLVSIEELCRQLRQLQENLELNKAIDSELTNILVNNFNVFCSKEFSGATYYELLYQKDLMNDLLSGNVLISENSIREVLFYFNFNNDDFVAYLFEKLKSLAESLHDNKEKIAALRFEQKTINQFRTKLNCYLLAGMPSLKEQLNSWIEEEIKFLQIEPTFSNGIKAESENLDKIQTSLSVSKLALLVRLMVIDKIITNRVVAQVLRVVIRTVATAQVENIGFSSFESKYHKADKGTISAVKDMLFKWINIVNQL